MEVVHAQCGYVCLGTGDLAIHSETVTEINAARILRLVQRRRYEISAEIIVVEYAGFECGLYPVALFAMVVLNAHAEEVARICCKRFSLVLAKLALITGDAAAVPYQRFKVRISGKLYLIAALCTAAHVAAQFPTETWPVGGYTYGRYKIFTL